MNSTQTYESVESVDPVAGAGAGKFFNWSWKWALGLLLVGAALVAVILLAVRWIERAGEKTVLVRSQGGTCDATCPLDAELKKCKAGEVGTQIVAQGVTVASYLGNPKIAKGNKVPAGEGVVLATACEAEGGTWVFDKTILPNSALGGSILAATIASTLASSKSAGKIVPVAPANDGSVPTLPSDMGASNGWRAVMVAVVGDGSEAFASPGLQSVLTKMGAKKIGSVKAACPYALVVDVRKGGVADEEVSSSNCRVVAGARLGR